MSSSERSTECKGIYGWVMRKRRLALNRNITDAVEVFYKIETHNHVQSNPRGDPLHFDQTGHYH